MKGFVKSVKRTPHNIGSRVGLSKKSVDPEFEDYSRALKGLEDATEKLMKETKAYTESVVAMFTAGSGFASHFATVFHPIQGEYDLIGKHPEAGHTIKNVDAFQNAMEELQSTISPELQLIESRVIGPVKEIQGVLKLVRKSVTKREHKLVDYDRFNNSLTKLREKKEKSLGDEKNLFKLEQDFELASNDYEYINNALKTELPQFFVLCTRFIDPLFHSFYYMQLNIFYMLLEKMQTFSDGKFDISNVPGSQIASDYEQKRTDAWEQIENLAVTKRIISTSKLVQAKRAETGSTGSSINRMASTASSSTLGSTRNAPPVRSPSSVSAASFKKAPPPPPGAASPAAPPPYTPSAAGSTAAAAAAAKRAPPPPPPLKPKPQPAAQYVVALYDFEAQADGDLSFRTGDRIEIVEKTGSSEDWWTGRLDGQQGVFPGNYVQEA